jgi:hypothetical protein
MMLASAGSAVLAGCGGGGGGGDSSASAKVAPSTDTSTQAATGTASASTTASTTASTANTTAQTVSSADSSTATNSGSSTNTDASTDTTQPADETASTTPPVPNAMFYGINGHMAWGSGIYKTMSQADQLAILKDLGVTNYRCDIADGGMATTLANALKGPFANSGVAILPVLNPISANWDPSSTEAAAYQLGYDLGVRCTRPLVGLVKYIECGNEVDVKLKISGDGSNTQDWSAAYWPSFRGVIRGMIAGVKAIDPTIQCGVNVGIPMAYRALQMLWNGITPNGTADGVPGATPLTWDFTTYHWYHSSGNIECGGRNNACVNILQVLKDSFNVPIWLTEWGWSGSKDAGQPAATYTAQSLAQYLKIKDKYNIQSIMMYAVIDDSYGLIKGDGVTKTAAYDVFKSFVAANPL